jgi:hypothetical protein
MGIDCTRRRVDETRKHLHEGRGILTLLFFCLDCAVERRKQERKLWR